MPSAVGSKAPPPERHDDLDNYDVGDLSDDPFASPPPDSKKRKEPDSNLGIDQEVSVQKRARVPNIKLDEDRLLSAQGIPKLRSRAHNLKLKGKGHEFGDAARLLSFYQLWLDDLFPKAKFLDALSMVEKAGHKKKLMAARNEWINDGKPKTSATFEEYLNQPTLEDEEAAQVTAQRPSTPSGGNDIPEDDDLYGATPRRTGRTVPVVNNDEPDADDLEALMAEAQGQDSSHKEKPQGQDEPEDDDLDALIAEAEDQDTSANKTGSSQKTDPKPANDHDFADEEAAMQEMEGLW